MLVPSSHPLDGAKGRRLMQLIVISHRVRETKATTPVADALAKAS